MRDIIAGCCQFSVKPGDVDANLITAERALSELAAQDCRLAVLPEMWSCSFPYAILPAMAERTPEVVEKIRDMARQKGMVIVGSLPEADGGTIYNTSYVIDSTGEVAGTYRKVHLFTLYGEHKNFGRGKSAEVFSTSVGKIGAIICYELRFPELTRKLALAGAEIICVSALWPHVRIYHWSLLLRPERWKTRFSWLQQTDAETRRRLSGAGGRPDLTLGGSPFHSGNGRQDHRRGPSVP